MRTELSTEPLSPEPNRIARSPAPPGAGVAPWTLPPAPPPAAEWQRYLAAALRFKWVVLGVTLASTALGVLGALLVKPTYVARATVWVQVPIRPARDEGPIWSGQLPISSGWMDLLQSYAVLDDVVRGLHLYVAPVLPGTYRLDVDAKGQRFTLTAHGREAVAQEGSVGDSVGAANGFAWVPPASVLTAGRRVEFTVTAPYEATGRLAKELKASVDLDGNFLRMELGGPNPALVTATVNPVADRFVEVAAGLKREKLTELSRILGTQLAQAQVRLGQTEDSLRIFRVRAVTAYASQEGASVTPNLQYQRDPMFAGLLDVKVSREEARRDRATIERVLAQGADSALAVDALGMVGSVQRSTELAQALRDLSAKQADLRTLRAHYTDASPAVRRLAAEVAALERQTIPALAGALAAELRVREQQLGERVDVATADLRKIPPLAVEETRLQRAVTLAEQVVVNLQRRYEEARLAEVSSLSDVRVLDRAAVPQVPAGSLGPILIALAMIGGLGLGVGGAVLLDHADRHVHHPDHVTQRMGLAILGAVPHVDWNNGKREESAGQVIEALRGVRLSVAHRHGAGPVIVTVTSPGRSDGKSFVASNLALAFADAGSRTLLIDGDVRRGRLHHVLNRHRRPGLTEILAGVVPLEQAVQGTSTRNLSFISCGARSHAGPALLSSAAMVQLVGQLRGQFGAIIVDSAPLGAGADGFALGTATGSLLVVLRTGVSDRELAEAKLGILQHLPINVLGAVLNDVRPGGAYRYYSYYLEGYGTRDELDAADQQVLQDPVTTKSG